MRAAQILRSRALWLLECQSSQVDRLFRQIALRRRYVKPKVRQMARAFPLKPYAEHIAARRHVVDSEFAVAADGGCERRALRTLLDRVGSARDESETPANLLVESLRRPQLAYNGPTIAAKVDMGGFSAGKHRRDHARRRYLGGAVVLGKRERTPNPAAAGDHAVENKPSIRPRGRLVRPGDTERDFGSNGGKVARCENLRHNAAPFLELEINRDIPLVTLDVTGDRRLGD
jgi:hypothetical protein